MISFSKEQTQKTRRLLLITGVLVTFVFWFPLEDPINLPKMFVLLTFTAWISGTTLVAFFYQRSKSLALGEWALVAFALGVFLAALLTDVRFTAFFGASHRNDGALSYLALAALAFTAMNSFDLKNIHQLRFTLLIVGGLSTVYGIFQTSGNDPFNWHALYNPVFGTVGNPDFFSALVGVCAIATVWFLLAKDEIWMRVSGSAILLLELFIVKRSGSFQGLLIFVVGATILILAKTLQMQRRAGLILFVAALLGGILTLFGLLNKGPLASLVYRASLQNRQDYWHAALNMFKAHPLTGVGLERFAENYPRYAPQVQFNPGQNSDNAHNVFLQLLATGGLLVIVPYLVLIVIIFWTAIRGIGTATLQPQIELVGLFSVWFALLLISFISIDNLGVTAWFWLSGGALYAATRRNSPKSPSPVIQVKEKNATAKGVGVGNSSYMSPITSIILVVIVLVLVVPVLRTSGAIYSLSGNRDGLTKEEFVMKLVSIADASPRNAQTLSILADLALRVSDSELALKFTKLIMQKDPESWNGNFLSASAYEVSGKPELAIPYRLRLVELDPWNAQNMLQIVKDYLAIKDVANAKAMADKIAQFVPRRGEADTADTLIKG